MLLSKLKIVLVACIVFVTLEVLPPLLQELTRTADPPLQTLGRTRRSPARGAWHLRAGVRDCGHRVLAHHQGAGPTRASSVQQSIPEKAWSSGEILSVSSK